MWICVHCINKCTSLKLDVESRLSCSFMHGRDVETFHVEDPLFSLTVRFRTTSGLDSAVDPIQMKNVTFEHVKGVEEAKNELQDVVEFLMNPQKFTVLGGKLPKGKITALISAFFEYFCF